MTAATGDVDRDGDACTAPDDVDCSDRDVFPCFPCYLSDRAGFPTDDGVDHDGGSVA